MEPHFAELVGVAAAAASLYAAQSKTIIPLRAAAIAANIFAMIYSVMHGTYPTFLLNAILLPVNAWRLHAMVHLIRAIDAATKGDLNVDWLLPYTRPKVFKAGHILMKRGDYATAAFYIVSGEVDLIEIDQSFGKGPFLGEIRRFTGERRRTMTVRCKTDVQTAVIDYDQFKELYFQNPEFGFRLLRLVGGRRRVSPQRSQPGVPS